MIIPDEEDIEREDRFESLLGVKINIFIGRAQRLFAIPSSHKFRCAGKTCLVDFTRGSGVLE